MFQSYYNFWAPNIAPQKNGRRSLRCCSGTGLWGQPEGHPAGHCLGHQRHVTVAPLEPAQWLKPWICLRTKTQFFLILCHSYSIIFYLDMYEYCNMIVRLWSSINDFPLFQSAFVKRAARDPGTSPMIWAESWRASPRRILVPHAARHLLELCPVCKGPFGVFRFCVTYILMCPVPFFFCDAFIQLTILQVSCFRDSHGTQRDCTLHHFSPCLIVNWGYAGYASKVSWAKFKAFCFSTLWPWHEVQLDVSRSARQCCTGVTYSFGV